MSLPPPTASGIPVWFIAAGFGVPGGIEAHIVHYAQEMGRRGFSIQVVTFFRLPKPEHRFLALLRERGVPIRSMAEEVRARELRRHRLSLPFWRLGNLIKQRRAEPRARLSWILARAETAALGKALARERPVIVHVFGRLPNLAWSVLPAERTIFHEMMTGLRDSQWTDAEAAAFAAFAERCVFVFAPGESIAANLRRTFGIQREITPVYTLCPDTCEQASRIALAET